MKIIENQNLVVAFLGNGGIQTVRKAAKINDPNLGIVGSQVGNKAVRIAILHNQNAACTVPFNHGIAVVAVKEGGILIIGVKFFRIYERFGAQR